MWTGEGWEGTWGPLVGDPWDLWTLGRISRDLGILGWMLRGGDGQCFSLCRSLSPLGIQLRVCFDCSSHTLAYNLKSIVIMITVMLHFIIMSSLILDKRWFLINWNAEYFQWVISDLLLKMSQTLLMIGIKDNLDQTKCKDQFVIEKNWRQTPTNGVDYRWGPSTLHRNPSPTIHRNLPSTLHRNPSKTATNLIAPSANIDILRGLDGFWPNRAQCKSLLQRIL